MIRPSRFFPNPETALDNAFQQEALPGDVENISALAQREFDQAVATLRAAGVTVHAPEDTVAPVKPDAVFPNNWFSTHPDGRMALYPMYSRARRAERRCDIIVSLGEHYRVTEVVDYSHYENRGLFLEGTGSLVLDPQNPANDKVEVTFPINKVSTTLPALDTHLQSADFFDAVKYPEGKFTSTSVTVHGTTATIVGNLTIKDVTRPITLEARLVGAGTSPMGAKKPYVGFAATTTINRSDFHLGFAPSAASDKVDLVINAGFVQT